MRKQTADGGYTYPGSDKVYGRKPHYRMSVMKIGTPGEAKRTSQIGRAWAEEDGSITIQLGPCVVLTSEDRVSIKLFPIGEGREDEA